MSQLGNRLVVTQRRRIKRKNTRESILPLRELEKNLKGSPSYLGAIYVSSFKSLVVKSRRYSFLIYCNHHWIVLYCTENNIEIFDSLGFLTTKSCVTQNVLNFIRNQIGSRNFKANRTIQSSSSKLCGIYALYYILKRDNGYSFDKIMNNFTNNLTDNDNLMRRFFNKLSQ